jgi:hypothetical protein
LEGRKILFPVQGADFCGEPWIAAPGFKLQPVLVRGHRSIIFLESFHEKSNASPVYTLKRPVLQR